MPETEERNRTYGQWWDTTEEMVDLPLAAVERVSLAALQEAGASRGDAEFLLDVSLEKALQGDHARGMGRIIEISRGGAARERWTCTPRLKRCARRGPRR